MNTFARANPQRNSELVFQTNMCATFSTTVPWQMTKAAVDLPLVCLIFVLVIFTINA